MLCQHGPSLVSLLCGAPAGFVGLAEAGSEPPPSLGWEHNVLITGFRLARDAPRGFFLDRLFIVTGAVTVTFLKLAAELCVSGVHEPV